MNILYENSDNPNVAPLFPEPKMASKVDVLGRFDGAFSQVPFAKNFDMSWLA
jgi:hypothetical protein